MVFSKKFFVAGSNEIATPFVGVGAKNSQKYEF
jgi:hypothetical protein